MYTMYTSVQHHKLGSMVLYHATYVYEYVVTTKTTVNPVLVVDKYPLLRPDDLMSQLAGGQRFSKIDLSQAYQQVQLDDESHKFVTHQGLYQYTRVPFGISLAPALFQKIMDTILQGVPYTICYLDDIILVTRKNEMSF